MSPVEHVRGYAARPFVWGEHDCALAIADWVGRHTGCDPAAHLRGRYASEGEARALMGPLGLVGIVRDCARAAGLTRTFAPAPGDIGVIRVRDRHICALRVVGGWVWPRSRGFSRSSDAPMVAAWSLPDGAANG